MDVCPDLWKMTVRGGRKLSPRNQGFWAQMGEEDSLSKLLEKMAEI